MEGSSHSAWKITSVDGGELTEEFSAAGWWQGGPRYIVYIVM